MAFDKLRALSDREQARDKLPVWYGSRDNFLHGFREVAINNPVDEITNNFESGIIDITLHDDNKTITVSDTGRGIPINGRTGELYNWEIFFTKMFASGKYDLEDGENSGTNGVGGTVLNYTSLVYDVRSCHDGKEYIIEFADGGKIKTPLAYVGETKEHGTTITFKLDPEMYTSVEFTQEDLKGIIDKVSSVSPKTTINFHYKEETTSYHFDKMLDYYKANIEANEDKLFIGGTKEYTDSNEVTKIEAIFSMANKPIQYAFLNRNYLAEGGKINDGIIEGIKLYAHKYADDNKLYNEKEKGISNEDVRNSISFQISLLSSNVEFQSQTKFSTKKTLYGTLTKKYMKEYLELFELEKPEEFKQLVELILLTKRANEKAEDSRKKAKDGAKGTRKQPLPSKLADCSFKTPFEKREISIVEGDSAGGSAKQGADRKRQAVMASRGKILNVEKQKFDRIEASEELVLFGNAIGEPLGQPYIEENLRYNRVIIMTDADVDGCHIRTLWMTYCFRYYRELIENGHLYISQPPLYKIQVGKVEHYVYSDDELEPTLKELGLTKQNADIQRFKGLGEMSATQMWDTTMNPETRRLYQVTIEDAQACDELIKILMGDKVDPRKEFIKEHSGIATLDV